MSLKHRLRGKRALVIGASGFIGRHLALALAAAGAEVHGTARRETLLPASSVTMHRADLLDRVAVMHALNTVRPTHVFNVAGRLKPVVSDPEALWRVHVEGTQVLFEAIAETELRPVVFIAGSAAAYGVSAELPVRESAPLRAQSPYGVSKVEQERAAREAGRRFGIPVVCVRSFNLLGPGLSPELIASQVARDIASAEKGGEPVIRVGNLAPRRDFLDIRDAVRAFLALAEWPPEDAAVNVCLGRSVPVAECVERLIARARVPLTIDTIAAGSGVHDVADIYGATERLAALLPWRDFIPLEQSLDDLLDDWRTRLAARPEGGP